MTNVELAKRAGISAPPCLRRVRALEKAGFGPVQYLEVADEATMTPVERPTGPARVLAAAFLGRTRLIDNVPVPRT